MNKLLTGIVLCLLLVACSKNKGDKNDKTPPVITLASPAEATIYGVGQEILIKGIVEDEQPVNMIHFHVVDFETGRTLHDIHHYPGTNRYEFEQRVTVNHKTTCRVQVIAIDASVNEGRVTRMIEIE